MLELEIKTDDYLWKLFNQKPNINNALNKRIQFKKKPITPTKNANVPNLSFFTNLTINPTIVVIIVKNINITVCLSKSKIPVCLYKKSSCSVDVLWLYSSIVRQVIIIIEFIVIIIITILAKIKDIIPNKLCFFISNLNLNHIIELKHYIKNIGWGKNK